MSAPDPTGSLQSSPSFPSRLKGVASPRMGWNEREVRTIGRVEREEGMGVKNEEGRAP